MNIKCILFMPLILDAMSNANTDSIEVNAEYCLYKDDSISYTDCPTEEDLELRFTKYKNGSINCPTNGDLQLKLTKIIKKFDSPELTEKQLSCEWYRSKVYVQYENEHIRLQANGGIGGCFDCPREFILEDVFYSISPNQFYCLHHIGEYDFFNSLIGEKILVKWEMKGACDVASSRKVIFSERKAGNYYITITGKCSDEDLKNNKNFDCRNPINSFLRTACE